MSSQRALKNYLVDIINKNPSYPLGAYGEESAFGFSSHGFRKVALPRSGWPIIIIHTTESLSTTSSYR